MPKLTLRKPEAIILELTGCIATSAFMAYSAENRTFVRQNIEQYFKECYPKQKTLRLDVQFFQLQEVEDDSKGKNTACPRLPKPKPNSRKLSPPEIITHILWKLTNDITSPPMSLFIYHMTEWGYKRDKLVTPIYEEVIKVFNIWKSLNIDIYINMASATFVNLVLSKTNKGSLAQYFSGHMNLVEFEGTEAKKIYHKLPEMLDKPSQNILFITRFPLDARAAKKDFIPSVLILREDYDPDTKKKLQKAELDQAAEEWTNENRRKSDDALKTENSKQTLIKEDSTVGEFKSGIINFSSTLHMINEANKKKLEEPGFVSNEELEGTFVLTEENSPGDIDVALDVRNTPSKIITSDIRELNVIESLADLNFVEK